MKSHLVKFCCVTLLSYLVRFSTGLQSFVRQLFCIKTLDYHRYVLAENNIQSTVYLYKIRDTCARVLTLLHCTLKLTL